MSTKEQIEKLLDESRQIKEVDIEGLLSSMSVEDINHLREISNNTTKRWFQQNNESINRCKKEMEENPNEDHTNRLKLIKLYETENEKMSKYLVTEDPSLHALGDSDE